LKRFTFVTRSGRKNRVVMLARYPRLGEVKTRLVPPLSAEGALDLHDRLARHTLHSLLAAQATGDARAEVRTDAAFARVAYDWLGRGFAVRYQGEGDLGDRIRLAFGESFARGSERVVVVGSDCPRLSATHLRDALSRLDGVDVVLGPADDGGYYLVALAKVRAKESVPVLFSGVEWGTSNVLDRTLSICEENGLTWALLEQLPDVDRPDDVAGAELALAADTLPTHARVSVVIPALDDVELVSAAIASARAGGASEVIVADGGSRDRTREIAEKADALVVESPAGRAAQMNAGAAVASGDILLFLHADTLLPANAAALARDVLATPGTVAGAFGFAVPPGARFSRLISAVGSWRARLTGRPYGDQALFLSARVFREMGGFPDLPTMEDLEMVMRLQRLGRIAILDDVAVTSARAWERNGLVRTTLVNLTGIVAYRMGADPERVAWWRKRATGR
jgi:rSAM/selenodomain-associated transferase 2/rSAM/selenodomain-associated transferase 1